MRQLHNDDDEKDQDANDSPSGHSESGDSSTLMVFCFLLDSATSSGFVVSLMLLFSSEEFQVLTDCRTYSLPSLSFVHDSQQPSKDILSSSRSCDFGDRAKDARPTVQRSYAGRTRGATKRDERRTQIAAPLRGAVDSVLTSPRLFYPPFSHPFSFLPCSPSRSPCPTPSRSLTLFHSTHLFSGG